MPGEIKFRSFDTNNVEADTNRVHGLVSVDLTEPYTIAIYLYFFKNWPELALFAYVNDDPTQVIGAIVGSLKAHQDRKVRGYIAMLAVQEQWRGKGIAKQLISHEIEVFRKMGADEIVLEAKSSNDTAIHLYESQGFLRTRRMHNYYFIKQDAFRLVLPLTERAMKPLVFLPELEKDRLEELAEAF